MAPRYGPATPISPALTQIALPEARWEWHATGAAVVADIGTGVDPTQPVLQKVLVPGYNFLTNQTGGYDSQVNQYAMAVVNSAYPPLQVNQYAMAVVNQQSATTLSQSSYSDSGHGTMVAGIIHLVAPTARILPLRAFGDNGEGLSRRGAPRGGRRSPRRGACRSWKSEKSWRRRMRRWFARSIRCSI